MKKPKLKDDEAFCARCKKIKSKKEFYLRKNTKKPFSYCMECQNEVKILKLKEKLERIIEERGGECFDCKIVYPMPLFDFYLDGNVYQLNKAKNMSIERLKEELKYHAMLCKNCCAMRQWLNNE